MNKIKFSKWRKGLVLSATFLFALFLVVSCKKKDSLLGQNSLDSNELLNSGGIDTFSLNTFSIFEDSVITDNPAFAGQTEVDMTVNNAGNTNLKPSSFWSDQQSFNAPAPTAPKEMQEQNNECAYCL